MNYSAAYVVGRADQDRYKVSKLDNNVIMYAIYDGHGDDSHTIAELVRDTLPDYINDRIKYLSDDNVDGVTLAIISSFVDLDKNIKDYVIRSCGSMSGTTATVLLIKGKHAYMANVGDTRGIIYDNHGRILLETVDHDCKNLEECDRIIDVGGTITHSRVQGILSVTRSFCDYRYKVGDKHQVSSIPSIQTLEILESGLTAIIASDGLWHGKYKNSSDVVKVVIDSMRPLGEISSYLTELAIKDYSKYGYPDDVTVVVIKI